MTSRSEPSEPASPRRRPRVLRYIFVAVLAFGCLAAYGIVDRDNSKARLQTWTDAQAVPSVNLVSPKHATENQSLALPANVEAFYDAPIHSRVNGYVKMWYFDI